MIRFVATVLVSVVSGWALAGIYQCPTNTKFVYRGDSIAQVIKECGKPKRVIHVEPKPRDYELWQYTTGSYDPRYRQRGFSVIFTDGHVVKIHVGKNKFIDYIHCSFGSVVRGASMHEVLEFCGVPTFKQQLEPQHPLVKQPKITRLIYQPQSYRKTQVFIFDDNKLEERLFLAE